MSLNDPDRPRLYNELSTWWPLLSPPSDYAEEAAFYQRTILDACAGPCATLLELGSGGGNNASHMKARFSMVLVDPAPGMLALSRALNPECEHAEGDMRTVRLNRQFDAVFVQDAICYMATEADLRAAIETAWLHCKAGGAALFAPDHVRENFAAAEDCGGHDGDDRAMRYLEWMWDPDPADSTYIVHYAYMLREPDGRVHVEHDRHVEGLFAREDWLRIIREVGFEPAIIPFNHSELEPDRYIVFVAKKPQGDVVI